MCLFALKGSEDLGHGIATAAGSVLNAHEERDFEDGEHKALPLDSVRGEDVYVLHDLAGDGSASAIDRLLKLLLFLATCREHGARTSTSSSGRGKVTDEVCL